MVKEHGVISGVKELTIDDKSVINLIMLDGNTNAKLLSQKTNIPFRTMQRILSKLQKKKIIKHIGSRKQGYWKIIENDIHGRN